MRVAVFAPHPDDDLIGCGGSILKWVDAGAHVSMVYLTSGDAPIGEESRTDIGAVREGEAIAAAGLLGVHDLTFLREPDGALAVSEGVLTRTIAHIRARRPHVVYFPHAMDNHPDHMATSTIVQRSLNDAAGPWWPESGAEPWSADLALAYEVWTPISRPSYLEDTTDYLETQVQALAEHRSQLAQVPYDAFVRGLGGYRGAVLGHGRAAEAFEVFKLGLMPGFPE